MIKDLVCGMEADDNASYSLVFEGEKYFFCSQDCRAEFKRHPQDYLTPPAEETGCCGKPSCRKTEVKGEKRNV
ncbi:MAG TPA: YHS domain-containing protein [Pyrinomonadaceae bacterium]|nr:YHS domain-containing protein [Pyrinomonadaceae bacterium]